MAKKKRIDGFLRVVFSADEIDQLKHNGLEHMSEPLQEACELSLGTMPNLANRKKRLEKMHAAVKDFVAVIDDIQAFAHDFFPMEGATNPVGSSAGRIRSELHNMDSLLASKELFFKTSGGRPKNERALTLARYVKFAFEEHGLEVASNQAGDYYKAFVTCLDALQSLLPKENLPRKDPTRIVNTILKDKTLSK